MNAWPLERTPQVLTGRGRGEPYEIVKFANVTNLAPELNSEYSVMGSWEPSAFSGVCSTAEPRPQRIRE